MTDIKALLDVCPLMAGYSIDELRGMNPGVFPQGVVGSSRDILGNVRVTKRYKLKKRCARGASWGQELAAWAVDRGLTVLGGLMVNPATETTGIYELTVERQV